LTKSFKIHEFEIFHPKLVESPSISLTPKNPGFEYFLLQNIFVYDEYGGVVLRARGKEQR